MGGDLVSIADASENAWVKQLVDNQVWIGMNDKATEGTWVWSDGTPKDYTNWKSNEPNNSGSNEDCVMLYASNGKWNDGNCTGERGAVYMRPLRRPPPRRGSTPSCVPAGGSPRAGARR